MTRKTTAIASIAALTLLAACKGGGAADADAAATETATVGTENIAVVVSGVLQNGPTVSGNLMPEKDATIRAQVGGSVLQTYADQGQRVSRTDSGANRRRRASGRLPLCTRRRYGREQLCRCCKPRAGSLREASCGRCNR